MIIYGYAKNYRYDSDGSLRIQVRIPAIHGAYRQKDYNGKLPKNYVLDNDLPYYHALLMPVMPAEGDVVALLSSNSSDNHNDLLVIGATGGSHSAETSE